MKLGLVLLMAAACGPGLAKPTPPKPPAPGEALIAAANDPAAIAAMLDAPLSYGGLWFSDPSCTQQFPTQSKLTAERIPAFAACLAGLPLRLSKRIHMQADIAVLDYAPGFEIEIQLRRGKIIWIGYAGRREPKDALPTISGEAFAALRTDHTPAPELRTFKDSANKLGVPVEWAWFKVCLDATGAVTGVHTREVTSPEAEQALTDVVKTWTFGPFAAEGSALPVCAMTMLTTSPRTVKEMLPLEATPEGAGYVQVARTATRRLAGDAVIMPDDDDKTTMQRAHVDRIVVSFKVCFDERGEMEKMVPIQQSGLPGYDDKIARKVMSSWKFRPVTSFGTPVKACGAVTWIYSQR